VSFVSALQAAWQGFKVSLKTERNFRIHACCAFLAVTLGFVLAINTTEWLFIWLSISLVWAAELFNTALEAITNLVSPNYHDLARKAKDAAAAAVLVMAVFSFVCGMIIFLPKLIQLLIY